MRYFLELSYSGKAYCGWQVQPGDPSVQQAVQQALSTLLRHETVVVGAGRTDTGVHASFYVPISMRNGRWTLRPGSATI